MGCAAPARPRPAEHLSAAATTVWVPNIFVTSKYFYRSRFKTQTLFVPLRLTNAVYWVLIVQNEMISLSISILARLVSSNKQAAEERQIA